MGIWDYIPRIHFTTSGLALSLESGQAQRYTGGLDTKGRNYLPKCLHRSRNAFWRYPAVFTSICYTTPQKSHLRLRWLDKPLSETSPLIVRTTGSFAIFLHLHVRKPKAQLSIKDPLKFLYAMCQTWYSVVLYRGYHSSSSNRSTASSATFQLSYFLIGQ